MPVASKHGGFTLIELLIVVVIIGILAAIAIPKFSTAREKAYIAAMKSDLRNLVIAQELYHADNITFTSSLTAIGAAESQGITLSVVEATGGGWSATAQHQATTTTCAVFVGSASAVAPATDAGIVACGP